MASEPIPARPSECIEKARLLVKYNHDVAELDRTTTMLERDRPALSRSERKTITSFAEKLCIRVEETREALQQHIAEHGC
jgi:hypothetical protein